MPDHFNFLNFSRFLATVAQLVEQGFRKPQVRSSTLLGGSDMVLVYALYSPKFNRIYIGQTSNLDQRLSDHKKGYSKATSFTNDWEVIYSEEYLTRSEAFKRERQLKTAKGRSYLWEIIKKK